MSFHRLLNNSFYFGSSKRTQWRKKIATKNVHKGIVRRRIEFIHELKSQGLSKQDIELLLMETEMSASK